MKKIIKLISTCALALVCVFSSGCVFSQSNYNQNPNLDAIVQDVEFNTSSEGRTVLSKEDATALVERSVVYISMDNSGSGAGVIVDLGLSDLPNSSTIVYIITCHHIVTEMGGITVSLPNEQGVYKQSDWTFKGTIGGNLADNANKAVTLVGGDLESDLAVLKLDLSLPAISGNILPVEKVCKAKIAPDEYVPRKGETIFAIGNPTGILPGWACYGEISLLETTVNLNEIGSMLLMGISATTNPGNSGGGLFNLYGELIGITNSGNTNYEAINFAIPLVTSNANVEGAIDSGLINVVKNLVGTYYDTEGNIYSSYGYIPGRKAKFGFTIEQVENGSSSYLKITEVKKNSLAEKAGLKVNDIIKSVALYDANGTKKAQKTVYAMEDFSSVTKQSVIGDKIIMVVNRAVSVWEKQDVNIELSVKQNVFGSSLD